jgi:hypothetical protein
VSTFLGALVFRAWTPSPDPATAVCLSRRLFHLPCPGCGVTRAFAEMAKGEWRAAFVLHPLAPLLALELAAGWLLWGWLLWGRRLGRRWPGGSGRLLDTVLWGHAAAFLALWLGRAATGTLPW